MPRKTKKDNVNEESTRPLEGEYIPPTSPARTINLNVERTKRYVRQFLDMGEKEARELLANAIQAKLILINDQILKQLEILDGAQESRQRLEAMTIISQLTMCAAQITENKLKLDKALGVGVGQMLPNRGEDAPAVAETSEDDFMTTYAEQASGETARKLITAGDLIIPIDPKAGQA